MGLQNEKWRGLARLDAEAFGNGFIAGGTICSHAARHRVSAWVGENRLVLGPLKSHDPSHEITAVPQRLVLTGCIVTIEIRPGRGVAAPVACEPIRH